MSIEERRYTPGSGELPSIELGEFDTNLDKEEVRLVATAVVFSLALGIREGLYRFDDGVFDYSDVDLGSDGVRAFTDRDVDLAFHLDIHAPRADGQSWIDAAYELAQTPVINRAIDEEAFFNE